jgi:hypothetical protein
LCAIINNSDINSINEKTVISSLESLRDNTLSRIKEIRKIEPTNKNRLSLGREAAFYSQLYINTILSIGKIEETELVSHCDGVPDSLSYILLRIYSSDGAPNILSLLPIVDMSPPMELNQISQVGN